MALLTRKTVVGVKAESTSGSAAGVAASNAGFNIFEASFSADVEQFERNPFRSTVGRRTSLAGVETGTISFTSELVGSGSTGTAPSIGALLLPCGFKEHQITEVTGTLTGTFQIGESVSQVSGLSAGVVVAVTDGAIYIRDTAGTSNTATVTGGTSSATVTSPTVNDDQGYAYVTRTTPSTYSITDVPTATVALYNDGIRHRLVGARGNVTFRVATGQPVQAMFEFQGPKIATDDQSLLSPTYPTSTPPTLLGAQFKTQGFSGIIDNLEVNTGNELSVRRSANASSGVIATEIVSRAASGSIDPEATKISGGHDWYGIMTANTTGILECTVTGGAGAAGNKFKIVAPNTQYSGVSQSDRNGIAVNQVDLSFNESSTGDDDIVILAL